MPRGFDNPAGSNRRRTRAPSRGASLRPAGPLPDWPPAPPDAVSLADRRRVLRGLDAEARRVVQRLLSTYGNWDEASLTLLKSFARSCARVAQFEAAGDPARVHRELRALRALHAALRLQSPVRAEGEDA